MKSIYIPLYEINEALQEEILILFKQVIEQAIHIKLPTPRTFEEIEQLAHVGASLKISE